MKNQCEINSNIQYVDDLSFSKPSTLGRLRSSMAGHIYHKYLKPFTPVNKVIRWIWHKGYPLYVKLNALSKRRLPLTNIKSYIKKNEIPVFKLVDATTLVPPSPKVFPNSEQYNFIDPVDDYAFPEIYVAVIKQSLIYGCTNLILCNDEVLCHDLYDFKRDSTSEELHGHILINSESNSIWWLSHDNTPVTVPVAAAFVDACATNYAHWMTEVLPRLALFCADNRFKDVPIVVDEGLHENIMQSLLLVAGIDREILLLQAGRALFVENLYLTSVAGYVPFGKRANTLQGHSHGIFSPDALDAVCNQLIDHLGGSDRAWPEKVYLRRNSGTRLVSNISELEKILFARGYEVVEPEHLTFLQQVQLFKSARVIISSTGAALCNAIFCSPGTQVAILISKHKDMIYRYWSNMLASRQVNVSYVVGKIDKNQHLGIHGDFSVNISDFLDLMEAVEE